MKITKVSDTNIKETPHKIDVRFIYDHPEAQLAHMFLKPGEALKPHITPVDVFIYVLEGSASITIGDETEIVAENAVVESPKDIVHYIANETDKNLRVLVCKTPRPTKEGIIL
ncbi:MAG: cupin domain-containing protein [Bacteroidetes bacterium]|nr:MAG: cupin domain-containing protein [Bacteroidota bacterium]